MIQNKKLKRNATYAIAEVAKVALCASNCALPTSGNLLLFECFDFASKEIGIILHAEEAFGVLLCPFKVEKCDYI